MLDPKTGNPTPRVCETTDGMMNSIGLENIGVKRFIEEQLPRWLKFGKPVIANISGYSVEEYGKTAKRLKNTGISGIEVNISCPNIKQDKTIFGLHPEKTSEIVNIVREAAPDMFLIVKLSSMASDIVEIAESAIFGGADALSLINTPLGMAIDVWTRKFKIANKMGGMSGKNIKPLALRMVYQLTTANLGVPIIGMGGISSGDDAMEFILAGASCISVGTELFRTPDIFSKINDNLKKFMDYYQVNNIQDLVGKVAL
jgi:dihydroorotate dehydrogenase (NAD+) catalytic subunit